MVVNKRKLNQEPLYKITLPGRKSAMVEEYVFSRRGIWTPWVDEVRRRNSGYHLIPRGDLAYWLKLLHSVGNREILDVWEVETDAIGLRTHDIVVSHRFRLKDRVFQSKRITCCEDGDVSFKKLQNIVERKLDEHHERKK